MSYPGKAQIAALTGGGAVAAALDWIVDTLHAQPFRIGGATVRSGRGTPAGVVTGNVGDLYLRTDGGTSTTLYVKETGGNGTTGWVAK